MVQQNNEYIYLIWKNPETRQNFLIGKLTRGDSFTFEYCDEIAKAEDAGYQRLSAFPAHQVYTSENMFPVFASRLPDKKRRDMNQILKKYGLEKYDEFELLRKSGARLPIDTYEFVDPIFPEDKAVAREFYIMGIRHHATCSGEDCALLPSLKVGDLLILKEEPENIYDSFAIQVFTKEGNDLGYIPRYFNKAILERLHHGMTYSCEVIELNPDHVCSECVKVRLNMPRK